jgi:hypothetical protein
MSCAPQSETESLAQAENPAQAEKMQAVITEHSLNDIAAQFVKLALAFGVHEANYVDAYTGAQSIADDVKANPLTLTEIEAGAAIMMAQLDAVTPAGDEVMRLKFLKGDLLALQTRLRMKNGETLSFDEETRLIYDAVSPHYTEADFAKALKEYDAVLPGEGPLPARIEAFQQKLHVPKDKMRAVMDAAISECQARTKAHYDLPEGERFDLEFASDKPWSAYNWYKGDYRSLIQVNTDLPLTMDRVMHLGCHEGYPGHHVYNILAERDRINKKGWVESTVVPLFSPSGPIMEGSGNYGVELAFPGDARMEYERDVLYPLAGVDPSLAAIVASTEEAKSLLSHVQTHVAREYLDGRMSREDAIDFMAKYGVRSKKRAAQSIDFIETYRGYVINYALGQDVIADYVERQTAKGQDPWDAFKYILDTPLSVSDLVE